MDTCRTVIFNPSYELYNDYDRIVLMSSPEASVLDKSYRLYIHPGIASFFSFFNGTCTLEESFQRAAKFYNTDVATVENLFSKFYNNPKKVGLKYDGENFIFPPNVLVDNREGVKRDTLSPEVMTCKGPYNYDRARLHYPKSLVICINLSCVTDCVYCYANKAHNYKPMPTQALLDFISEAARLHVRDIDFTGGEFFLHKDWREILKCLIANGYNPEISTKVPVSPASLREAREIGLKCVQYSLDTLSPEKACATLNVNRHYIGSIRKSIEAADSLGFDLVIKPTLVNTTCTLENVKEILEFTKGLRSVRRMVVTTAGYTMYKSEENYQKLRPSEQQAREVYGYLTSQRSEVPFPIVNDDQLTDKSTFRCKESFDSRSICSANLDGFVVLPDGQVTVCEGLYWHKEFIIGDISKMSIMDIWNYDNARMLTKMPQELIPEDSACRTCKEYDECRKYRGICWKYVLEAYGDEHPFYPDPRCPYAPAFTKNIC